MNLAKMKIVSAALLFFGAFLSTWSGASLAADEVNRSFKLSDVRTSLNPAPATDAPAGVFTISATFTNIGGERISDPYFQVAELTDGNVLLNADGGPGGIGSTLIPTVPNGALDPGESMRTDFMIGLSTRRPFSFFVDVFGVIDQQGENNPPVADAGPDQTRAVGDRVKLDGSGSSDPDGDRLTFSWELTSVPPGSAASLSNPTAVMPRFIADQPGEYVAELIVNDGLVDSAPDEVTIDTRNTRPVANAGADQDVPTGTRVKLDGTGSTDVDGDPLTFQWSLVSIPVGSNASLSDPTVSMPTFLADVVGSYIAELVVNDGLEDSDPDQVEIKAETSQPDNSPPVANAGADQEVPLSRIVTLDGSKSTDPDNDPLTYSWSLTTVPRGSAAVLSDPSAIMPTFTADTAGAYVAQLIVNDGKVDSAPDLVVVTTLNVKPVADAGPDQSVPIGTNVGLDGSGSSDADLDPLTYRWALTSVPAGSAAALSDSTAIMPTFTADLQGTYTAQLIVNDGTEDSAPDTVAITTSNPIADAGPDQMVTTGETVNLDGSGSRSTGGRPLTYDWAITSRPQGSGATLSSSTAQKPSFVADMVGNYIAELVVNDGLLDSLPDSVLIHAGDVPGGGDSLQCGDQVSGSIDAVGETDQYTFTGQVGQVVAITLTETAGFPGSQSPVATVFSPAGVEVSSFGPSQREITLPESGTYVIKVSANIFTSLITGSYVLSLDCIVPANPAAVALSCGSQAEGTISKENLTDEYTFTGQAGQIVAITLVEIAGFPGSQSPVATVFSPTGVEVARFGSSQREITLPESGTYVIKVSANIFTSLITGSYVLSLDCIVPANPAAVALSCGSQAEGTISKENLTDEYTFTGQAGQIVAITLVEIAGFPGSQSPVATVFSPTGVEVARFGSSQREITLPESGTYVIKVSANIFTSLITGSYVLSLDCIVPANPAAVALSCGSQAEGTISKENLTDEYTFTGQAGQIVAITLVEIAGFPGSQSPVATVFSPTGVEVARFGSSQREITLPESGTYVIKVSANIFTSLITGSYVLSLECL